MKPTAPTAKHAGKRAKKRGLSRRTLLVIRWLVFCFPAGLLMMWSDRCHWSRAVKSLVSVGFAALVTLIVLPQTLPPDRSTGGIEIVSLEPAVELLGPTQSAQANPDLYDVYVARYIDTNPKPVIAEPTPEPEPIYVYCNDGGKYYHSPKCRYVKPTTPRVSLAQALNAGFSRCEKCNAPKENA